MSNLYYIRIARRDLSRTPPTRAVAKAGLLGLLVSRIRLIRLAQPSQHALDEHQQLIERLVVRGVAAYDVLCASAERIACPPRFARELHDEGVVRGEPAPFVRSDFN